MSRNSLKEDNIAWGPVTSLQSLKEMRSDKRLTMQGWSLIHTSTGDCGPPQAGMVKKQHYPSCQNTTNMQVPLNKDLISKTLTNENKYAKENNKYFCVIDLYHDI